MIITMNTPELFIFLLLLGSACITGAVSYVLHSQLEKRGANWLLFTAATMTGWLCCDALIVAIPDISIKFAVSGIKFIFVILTPLAFFFFSLAYTGKYEGVSGWKRAAVALLPAVSICALLTNPWKHLFYVELANPSLWVYNHYTGPEGIWFWVNLVYSYALITGALLLLIGLFMSSPQHFRRQIFLLILSALAPFTANIIVIFTNVGTDTADITPLFFALSGILIFITVYWMHLFSIMPFARTRIITEIHEGVIVADGNGVVIDINSAACTAGGVTEKEAISLSTDTLLTGIFGITLAELSEARSLTVSHTNAAGETQWSDLTVSRVEGYDAQSGGTIILIRDATARRRAEEEIMAKDLRLKIAMEGAGLSSWEWREGPGYVTYDNPLADRTIENVTTIEGFTDQMKRCLKDGYEATLDEQFENILSGGKNTFSVEFPVENLNKGHWIQITGQVIERDEDNRPIWMVGITQDVSTYYAARAAIMEANTKIKLLTSITRHDVLNQVMVVRMLIELAGMEPKDAMSPEVKEIVTKIDNAAALIEEQISFTRDYEDLGTYTPSWQNVATVAAQAAGVVSRTGISFSCNTGTLEVYADPMFRKVIENLFENAQRHGGGVTALSVRFDYRGAGACLVVEDNGRGVPDELKKRIFSQGYGKNTGFGLFLSKEILALTNITITEEGTEGKGSQFVMHIPAGGYRGYQGE
ncbi:sensor histidine kinase [Methanogenium organophilum]|uniref:histidine kinase n=1 Tax=Methanogenium organophilum TaxID=2199 RepID=A0A9X9S6N9_METOG|nr:histidine kinase N-terminal 7TM domain-containing protein [Methanogenium organophilum]WAI02398.1 ATP-binding protein [Methanogenium organophilum]